MKKGRYVLFRGVNFSGRSKLAPYPPVAPPINIVFKFLFPEIKMPTMEELRLELQKVATDLDRLKALGFNVVRVPLSWKAIEPSPNPVAERLLPAGETYLLLVKEIIDALYARDIFVILDFHQDIAHEIYNGDGFPN
jgi:hypothetical protein